MRRVSPPCTVRAPSLVLEVPLEPVVPLAAGDPLAWPLTLVGPRTVVPTDETPQPEATPAILGAAACREAVAIRPTMTLSGLAATLAAAVLAPMAGPAPAVVWLEPVAEWEAGELAWGARRAAVVLSPKAVMLAAVVPRR
jgi:hypothetical protein